MSLAILILLSRMTALPALAQDLQLDLPEESGPARVQPAQPSLGKPEAKVQQEEEPAAKAAPEAPQETPQVEHESRPLRDALSKMSDRLLNILTTDNGTNRTAVIGRVQFSAEYRDRGASGVQLMNNARTDVPLAENLLWRTDVPFGWYDSQTSGSFLTTQLGDMSTRLGGKIWQRPELTVFLEGEVVFPTATIPAFGRGKYQLSPVLTMSIPIQSLDSVVFPGIQQFVSVGGDPSRDNVNYTQLSLEFTTPWARNQWWTTIQPYLYADWTQKGKTAMNVEFEVGKRLGEHFRVWLRPAVGLWGTGVPGAYDWFVQIGIRYMF